MPIPLPPQIYEPQRLREAAQECDRTSQDVIAARTEWYRRCQKHGSDSLGARCQGSRVEDTRKACRAAEERLWRLLRICDRNHLAIDALFNDPEFTRLLPRDQ